MSLYTKIGESTYDALLADPIGADKFAIPCEPGNGIVKRGTVMYRKSTGLWAPAASSNVVATNELAVLDETVDTTGRAISGGTVAEDAAAFRAGCFIRGKVVLAADAAVTAAHEVILRGQNIVFDVDVNAAQFNNVKA